MDIIYRTKDGEEFDDYNKAIRHESGFVLPPQPKTELTERDCKDIISFATDYVDETVKGYVTDPQELYEYVIEMVYGKEIWKYLNGYIK